LMARTRRTAPPALKLSKRLEIILNEDRSISRFPTNSDSLARQRHQPLPLSTADAVVAMQQCLATGER